MNFISSGSTSDLLMSNQHLFNRKLYLRIYDREFDMPVKRRRILSTQCGPDFFTPLSIFTWSVILFASVFDLSLDPNSFVLSTTE